MLSLLTIDLVSAQRFNRADELMAGTYYDERRYYERGQRQDHYQSALEEFNANIPLSPSISGESSGDDEVAEGGVTDWRAIQRWNRYRRHYCAKSTTINDKASAASFQFLNLPFDIRRLIYVLLVKRTRPVIQMESDSSGKHPGGPIDLRIAVASTQLFTEVMATVFEQNTIEFGIPCQRQCH